MWDIDTGAFPGCKKTQNQNCANFSFPPYQMYAFMHAMQVAMKMWGAGERMQKPYFYCSLVG